MNAPQIIQLIMMFLCACMLAIVGTRRQNEITKNMMVTGFLIMFQNVGYLMFLMAEDLNEALAGIKVEYIGTAYLVTFMLLFVVEYCRVKFSRVCLGLLIAFDTVVLLCVATCNSNRLYYSSIEFVAEPLPHIIRGMGPLYVAQMALILIQMAAAVFYAFSTWKKSRPGRYRASCGIIGVVVMIPVASYGLTMSGIAFDGCYDFMPVSAAFTVFTLGVVLLLGKMFDGQAIAYSGIIKKLKEPVILVDKDYRFVEANERAYFVFPSLRGLKEGDEIGEPMLLAAIQDDKLGEIISDDFIMRPDVQQIEEDGEMKGYAVLLADLTQERKQLEQSEQLKRAAEVANQAKSDFLARMSHEIRTPINAVLGMDEMILRESAQDSVRKYAIDIKNSANSLLSIINEILDLAKIESGKIELMPVNYEMFSLLNDLYSMVNIWAKEKKLLLVFDIQNDIPSGYCGDNIRLRQILMNLLTNAIKYTDEGCVTLSVRGGAKGDVGYLRFAVTDTGRGLTQDEIRGIYEKYRGFNVGRDAESSDTGLGMNITMRLLSLMGSELKVDSAKGKGSNFYFDLHQPVVNKEPLGDFSERIARRTKDYKWKPSFKARSARVLVVDDNRVNRRVFKNLLKETQMQIDEAASGKEALEMVAKTHYDLVFMDHMMPEMDGVETWHAMREMDLSASGNTSTPVVMLTANALVGAEEKYLQDGFSGFLPKPIVPEKLEALICGLLPRELTGGEE